ncbi:host specificity protein J, partial [Moraxella catarrhalis]|nr:host specificity protein J [Moraxella catarrhalis]
KSEQLETETVSFSTGLDGFIPKVGEIIHVQDNHRAGRMQAGRKCVLGRWPLFGWRAF